MGIEYKVFIINMGLFIFFTMMARWSSSDQQKRQIVNNGVFISWVAVTLFSVPLALIWFVLKS